EGAAMRSPASWYTCSAMARYSGATCIHRVACRLSRPVSGAVAAPATADAMKLATATNEPRLMNPPDHEPMTTDRSEYFRNGDIPHFLANGDEPQKGIHRHPWRRVPV